MKEIKMQEVPKLGEQIKYKGEMWVFQGINASGYMVLSNSQNTVQITISSLYVVFVEC